MALSEAITVTEYISDSKSSSLSRGGHPSSRMYLYRPHQRSHSCRNLLASRSCPLLPCKHPTFPNQWAGRANRGETVTRNKSSDNEEHGWNEKNTTNIRILSVWLSLSSWWWWEVHTVATHTHTHTRHTVGGKPEHLTFLYLSGVSGRPCCEIIILCIYLFISFVIWC